MKEIKLVKIEINKYVAWPVKIAMAILALYFAKEAYIDYSNEYVIRRGIQYTLLESPRSYYINLTKTIGICLFFAYLAIGGIVPKTISRLEKSDIEK
jgi:hypothetical protein